MNSNGQRGFCPKCHLFTLWITDNGDWTSNEYCLECDHFDSAGRY